MTADLLGTHVPVFVPNLALPRALFTMKGLSLLHSKRRKRGYIRTQVAVDRTDG